MLGRKITIKRQIIPGQKVEFVSTIKKFQHGVATGTSIGYVNGELACSADIVECVPAMVNQFKPIINTQ
jgi:3-hydroxyacyl-[acyl-carrier-protein] dehydratase